MKGFLRIAFLLLMPVLAEAQTFFPITHSTGTVTIGAIPVEVQGNGGTLSGVGQVCGVGPYKIGNNGDNSDYHRFLFGYPVNTVRLRCVNMGAGDTLIIFINGNYFPLSVADISPTLSAQFCAGNTDLCSVYNGLLGPVASGGNSKANIDFTLSYPISEITIQYHGISNLGNGLAFGIWYATEPHVYLKEPFTDTILCSNDSLQIPIKVSDSFDLGNSFKVQLSDANGSFSNPTLIGTRYSKDGGNILCGVPANLPEGANYRYRVVADMPADTSGINMYPIRISHYPTLELTTNSPVCEGDVLRLNATTNNTTLKWTGPSGFTATVPAPSFTSEMKYMGEYTVTASNYGCVTTSKTNVLIKPLPVITSISNNGPKCETETIQLRAKTNDTSAKFLWSGPDGFTSDIASPTIADVRQKAAGVYSVLATLDGCISTPDTTTLIVYPRPVTPVISVNNPVKPGDSLVFHTEGEPGTTYQWTGPAGFNSTEQNPVKRLVDNNDEGKYTVVAAIGNCTISSSVDIDVLQAALSYHLTPNPTSGDIHIYGNYLVDKTIPFAVVSATGQIVYSGEITTSDKFLDIRLDMKGRLSNGLYFIRLQLKDELLKIPFIVGQ